MSHPLLSVNENPWGYGNGAGGGAAVRTPLDPPGSGPVITKAIQLYLPEIYPIPEAQNFNLVGSAASVAPETGTVLAGCTLQLPANNVGVIRGLALYIDNMLTTTNVTWSLVVQNGVPQGFGNLSMFPRNATFVGNNFDILVRVPVGANVQVIFSNIDGGSYTVGAAISGWFWPVTSGDRWLAGGV